MKKVILTLFICVTAVCGIKAQTAAELMGKWKLIKWTKKGKEQDIIKEFKTDSVYQVFNPKNQFISVVGPKQTKSKWKLSGDNKMLTIRHTLITINFSIDYFDAKRRVITSDQLGTMEYEKVEE